MSIKTIRVFSLSYLLFVLLGVSWSSIKDINLDKLFVLEKDLEIGKEEAGEYCFGEISDVAIDERGNVYILDLLNLTIKKFNENGTFLKAIGRKGDGPGEFTALSALSIAVDSKGELMVLDKIKGKLSIFSENGEYLYSFFVKFSANGILIDPEDNIIIIGPKEGKIFHVYNKKGERMYSFGNLFEAQINCKECKKYPGWRAPMTAFFSKNMKRIYACNPFKYEIWSFTKNCSEVIVYRKSPFFKPFDFIERFGRKLKIRSLFPIFEKEDLMFITLGSISEGKYVMEIFKNYRYMGYLNVKGHLRGMDKKGRLYFIEEQDGYPKVVRYNLKKIAQ